MAADDEKLEEEKPDNTLGLVQRFCDENQRELRRELNMRGGRQLNAEGLSKTQRKKVLNAVNARVSEHVLEFDSMKKKLAEAKAEVHYLKAQVNNACSVLEAVVRRHGPQAFDRKTIETECKDGKVRWDVTPTRITVLLNPGPVEVLPEGKVS